MLPRPLCPFWRDMSLLDDTSTSNTRHRGAAGGPMSGKQLGFIGVGTMGHHMAGRLLEAGYDLIIFDTNESAMQRLEQRGAKRAASPADVASQCETILVSLPTPDVVKAVAYGKNGVIEGSKAKVFVDLSTTGSNAAREVAAALAKKAITAADPPRGRRPPGPPNSPAP